MKYAQVDALFIEGWSIDGLKKVIWPDKIKSPPESFDTEKTDERKT
jgi:hypothetical protein